MYRFKRISKTKMYQLVREFAGIRNLLPMRQCQFGYYSRTDTCYLCFKEGPDSFKAIYEHWGSSVYLTVFQKPGPDPLSAERNEDIPLNLHWLHEHGFLDKDPVKPAGEVV